MAKLSVALSMLGAALGAVGLLGLLLEIPALTAVLPGQAAMKANTALSLLLLGVAVAMHQGRRARKARRVASLLAATVVLGIGLATLVEYLASVDLLVDELLLSDSSAYYPGRMSPPTAFALAALAAAVLLARVRARPAARPSPAEWLALASAVTAYIALLGLAFGVGPLYQLPGVPVTSVALPTAIALLLISSGQLLARPDTGLTRAVVSAAPGGTLVRRLMPLALLAPIVLEAVFSWGMGALGVRDPQLIIATVVGAMGVLSTVLFARTAQRLNRTHQALEASRATTRILVDSAPDGIFVAAPDGGYQEVNDAGCRMLGYARDELLGKNFADLLPPEDVERLRRSRERLLAGQPQVEEWTLRRKDGGLVPVEVSAAVLPDGRWQAITRDITERKRTEAALRRAQESFELALRGADLAAWDWNIPTGAVAFNERWARMRGYRLEEIHPSVCSWLADIHPDDLPRVEQAVADHLEGRKAEYEAELRVKTKTGTWIWILDRGRVFERDDAGRPVRMVGTELDITARKQMEEQLRRAIRSRDEVLSIVAHDLRNPLSVVAMQAGLLRRRGPEAGRPADLIERAVQRMNRLIEDLLDVARIEAGQLAVHKRRLRPEKLVAEAFEANRAQAASAGLELRQELAGDSPDILADGDRLLQVLANLIGNAVKFTQPGGRVIAGVAPQGDQVRFWVADTGSGIRQADVSHLFDRFWQANRGERRGAGLGLSIAKGIVEAHGGRMWLESVEGRGSIFSFTIPAAPRVDREQAEAGQPSP